MKKLIILVSVFIIGGTLVAQNSYTYKSKYGEASVEIDYDSSGTKAFNLDETAEKSSPEQAISNSSGTEVFGDRVVVFRNSLGNKFSLPGGLYVFFKKEFSNAEVKDFLKSLGYQNAKSFLGKSHTYFINSRPNQDVLNIANELSQFDIVDFVELNQSNPISKR